MEHMLETIRGKNVFATDGTGVFKVCFRCVSSVRASLVKDSSPTDVDKMHRRTAWFGWGTYLGSKAFSMWINPGFSTL